MDTLEAEFETNACEVFELEAHGIYTRVTVQFGDETVTTSAPMGEVCFPSINTRFNVPLRWNKKTFHYKGRQCWRLYQASSSQQFFNQKTTPNEYLAIPN
ncbi:hypothetical protein OK016_27775 [Vibrio chagasii]|nr:hypothetical protein [Vibrio chagasii]